MMTAAIHNKVMQWIALGALLCLLSVLIGAFAAHGLKDLLETSDIEMVNTGARYQMYHGIAIILVSIINSYSLSFTDINRTSHTNSKSGFLSCNIVFVMGILCFSGSLYTIALLRALEVDIDIPRVIFLITPLGGLMLLLAWVMLVYKCLQHRIED